MSRLYWNITLNSHLEKAGFENKHIQAITEAVNAIFLTTLTDGRLHEDQKNECLQTILEAFDTQDTDLKKLATDPNYKKNHFMDDPFNKDVLMIKLHTKMKYRPNTMPTEVVAAILNILSPKLNDNDTYSLGDELKESINPSSKPVIHQKTPQPSYLQLLSLVVLITIKDAIKHGFTETAKALSNLLVKIVTALKSVKPLHDPMHRTCGEYGLFDPLGTQAQKDIQQGLLPEA